MSQNPDSGLAIVTVVTSNYFHFALAWAKSINRSAPDASIYVGLVDDLPAEMNASGVLPENVRLISLDELGVPSPDNFRFRYTPFEASCALKPFILAYALNAGHSRALYIDSDAHVFSHPVALFNESDTGSIYLTPHLIGRLEDDKEFPSEQGILAAGVYNGGVVGVVNDANGRAFLDWWGGKCLYQCITDFAASLHVDQKWLDLVPGLFQGVHISRNPGLHCAYWNLTTYEMQGDLETQITVNDRPMVVFHFSGVNLSEPQVLSKFQTRLNLVDYPIVADLIAQYIERVRACDAANYSRLAYPYNHLASGTRIEKEWREAARARHPWIEQWSDPFDDLNHPEILAIYRRLASEFRNSRVEWKLENLHRLDRNNRRRWFKAFDRYLRRAG